MRNISSTFENSTIIIIAHRLSTLEKCDRILKFADGVAIEDINTSV